MIQVPVRTSLVTSLSIRLCRCPDRYELGEHTVARLHVGATRGMATVSGRFGSWQVSVKGDALVSPLLLLNAGRSVMYVGLAIERVLWFF